MAENNIIVSAFFNIKLFFSSHIPSIISTFISYLSRTIPQEISNINDKKISSYHINEFTTINNRSKKNISLQKFGRINILLNFIYFVLGFSLVFAALGIVLTPVLLNICTDFQNTLQIIEGIVVIALGGLSKAASNEEKFVIYRQRVYNSVKKNNNQNKRSKLMFKEKNFKSTHLHLINWSIL